MAASSSGEFDEWLENELKALNTDQEVFGGYIKSILEGDETDDEKIEALEGILSEVSEEIITPLCKEILLKWTIYNLSKMSEQNEKTFDVNEKIVTFMEQQAQKINTVKKITDEEKQYRDAIVAQYSQVSDDEEGSSDETNNKTERVNITPHGSNNLERNVNAESVVNAEKERREQAKLEVEKKKAQDKVNREKQKQQQLERKEKEKKRTQKGERRR